MKKFQVLTINLYTQSIDASTVEQAEEVVDAVLSHMREDDNEARAFVKKQLTSNGRGWVVRGEEEIIVVTEL